MKIYVYISLIKLNKCQEIGVGFSLQKRQFKKIGPLDLQIIKALEEDSRASLNKLAKKIGKTPNILHNHLNWLENEGIILGYTPIIDSAKMGYPITAIIMIQIEGGHVAEVENMIAKDPAVLSVYDITGEYTTAVIVKFRDNSCLNDFLKSLLTDRYVKRTSTLIAMNAIKEFCKII